MILDSLTKVLLVIITVGLHYGIEKNLHDYIKH